MKQEGGIRVGVVGVGYWGEKHLRVLQSIPEVVQVVAIDERLPQLAMRASPVAHVPGYRSLEAGLPHVDAVVIATPPATHVPLGLQAISAGKHVLIEKPLATTAVGARTLVDAADEAGVTLMVGHTFEYNPAVWLLRELVRTRELGELYYLDSARLNLGLYRDDVNVIADLAPHDISIANYVLDARPTWVEAWGSRHVHPIFEDVAYLRLQYDEVGVRVNVHVSWLDPHKVRRMTAVGSKKMVVYNDVAEEKIRVYDKAAIPAITNGHAHGPGDLANGQANGHNGHNGHNGSTNGSGFAYHHGDVTYPHVEPAEPLLVQDAHFVDCIRNGQRPRSDGNSGLSVVEVLECAQRSLEQERRIMLREIAEETILASEAVTAGKAEHRPLVPEEWAAAYV